MKDCIFTIVGDDIYLCETPKRAKSKYGKTLHFIHHDEGINFYFTLIKANDLIWINLSYLDLELIEDQESFIEGLSHLWPYLSENKFSEKVYPLDKVTLFGGTFNPWHDGHSTCVKRVKEKSPLIIVPDKNPQKELSKLDYPLTSYIKLCLKLKAEVGLGSKWIYPGFTILKEGNPTSTWVAKIKNAYPNLKLRLAMGFDSAKNLKTWINSEELLKRLNGLYILSRMETDQERFTLKAELKTINSDLKIIFLGHHKFEEISSEKLRTK